MKFLIVGLGSMGKRRIRCLNALGYKGHVSGFDIRKDRCEDAKKLHEITILPEVTAALLKKFDCLIISVPPDKHNQYIQLAITAKIPAFVEASVNIEGLETLNNAARDNNVLIAPSCTLLFHPAIKDIKRIIDSGEFGKVTNFSYTCGQYLPDWHPWEKVSDFYGLQSRNWRGSRDRPVRTDLDRGPDWFSGKGNRLLWQDNGCWCRY